MKKSILLLILILSTTVLMAQRKTTLVIDFKDVIQNIQFQYNGTLINAEPNDKGEAILNLKISSPQYIQIFRVPSRPELIFIYPGKRLKITILAKELGKLDFEGKYAAINRYLNDPNNIQIGGGFSLEEGEYIEFLKERVDKTIKALVSNRFDSRFTTMETKRIASRIYTSMVGYPNIRRRTDRDYRPSDAFYNFIKDQLYEDEKMLSIKDYTDFIQYMYALLATKDISKYDPFQYAMSTLNYVIGNVKNEKIRSHLINYYAYDFVRRNGILEADPITEIFEKYVNDDKLITKYKKTWDTWAKITPGRIMPDMLFRNINNEEVSLKSLEGSYVYIDVWATWCKPCIAEIPNLKKMEEKLKDKNVTFLSISVDKDGDAWEKMIKEDNFTGLQWHSPTRKFSEELMIVSIPRFILIDPKGKIVDANVSRPDRDETYKLFDTLAGL